MDDYEWVANVMDGGRWVATVTATVMSGKVVRWYKEGNTRAGDELVSASRDGVLVRCFLHEAADVMDTANEAHRRLAAGGEVADLATHRRVRLLGDELEPVEPRHAET